MAPGFIAIGSGPAGVSAAETFRSKHPDIPVRILTVDPALPYAKPPLSKGYLCGREEKRDLHSAGWFGRNNVDLIRGISVDHIDTAGQEVVTAGGQRYPYWHLVVASGATPVKLNVPGAETALTLRSFGDAVALKMAARYADSAVVIGGGLIGCEAAACLAAGGVETALVAAEAVPLQRRFGIEAGERVVKILSDNGVGFVGGTTVAEIGDSSVVLDDGTTVQADLVVSATGVRPDIRLAESAGWRLATGASSSTSTCMPRRATSTPRVTSHSPTTSPPEGASAPSTGATPHRRVWSPDSRPPASLPHGIKCPDSPAPSANSVLKYRGWGATNTADWSRTTTGSRSGTRPTVTSSAC